ncbi:MAG: CHASE2 domain-containing protein [Acidiferrobacterales bacterium]
MRSLLRSPLVAALLVGILVFLGILGLRNSRNLEALEFAAYDWSVRLRPSVSEPSNRIVLITVTESDIQNQGRWPLPDAIVARVLQLLAQYEPRAIGLDIYRDLPVPPGRDQLNAALRGDSRSIVVMKFGGGTQAGVPPPRVLAGTDRVAFNDVVVDPGGTVRRGLLFLDDGKTVFYSFALRLALAFLQAEGVMPQPDPVNPEYIRLGETTIQPFEADDGSYIDADAGGYQFLLDFLEAPASFPSYPLTSVLAGEVDAQSLKDKIVLIGVTAESVKDLFYTPHSRTLHVSQEISGIELHAHIVSQLLRFGLDDTSPIATVSDETETLWILLWSLIGALIGLRISSSWRFSLVAASGLLVLGLIVYVLFLRGVWVPVVPPALGWFLSAAIVTAYMANREKQQRSVLMNLFSRHISADLAEAIWQQRDQFFRGGRPRSQELTATVMFTDLQGFTDVSEKLTPQTLMDWLNEYMEAMTPLVINHGGVILRFIGDAIMAAFGVPIARTTEAEMQRDAQNAVRSALDMERKLIALNIRLQEQQLPMIGMRIGIFTGRMAAGSMGNAQRLEYNVHGDTVNTAARLESFDKKSFQPDYLKNPCRILIGEVTLSYLCDQFETQKMGQLQLRGKNRQATIYRVIRQKDEVTDNIQQEA